MKAICEGCEKEFVYQPEDAREIWEHRFCSIECWRKDSHYAWLAGNLSSLWMRLSESQRKLLLKVLQQCTVLTYDSEDEIDRDALKTAHKALMAQGMDFIVYQWAQDIYDLAEEYGDWENMLEQELGKTEKVENTRECVGTYRGFDIWKSGYVWQYPKDTLRMPAGESYVGVCTERNIITKPYGHLELNNNWSGSKKFGMKPPEMFAWSKASYGRYAEYEPRVDHMFDLIDYLCYYDVNLTEDSKEIAMYKAEQEAERLEATIKEAELLVNQTLKKIGMERGKVKALQSNHLLKLRLEDAKDIDSN